MVSAATAKANALLAIGATDVADVDGVSSDIPASFLHEPALIMLKGQCARVASDDMTIVTKVHNTVNHAAGMALWDLRVDLETGAWSEYG